MASKQTAPSVLARTNLPRAALILVPGLMAVALLAAAWSNYRGVMDASQALVRGQAQILHDGIRMRLGQVGRQAGDADFQAVLDDLQPEGLRGLAFVGRGGMPLIQAGDLPPIHELLATLRTTRPETPAVRGGSAFVLFLPQAERRRRGWRGMDRNQPPLIVAFAPSTALQLRASARRTLGVGALTGAALLLIAVVLLVRSIKREREAHKDAHEKHLATLGELSAVMAHEIRNPLASLKGNAQLLARGMQNADPEKNRERVQRVVDEAVRLETLTRDLLDFARVGEITARETDPAELLRAVATAIDDERVKVDTTGAPEHWTLDPDRIRQVLTNLLGNAVQAGDGRTQATVTQEHGHLVFTVRDWGPGIAPDDLEQIFEPFFTRRTRGTGLGLAVARRLVSLHGGTITAENAEDGGARFRVSLPRRS